MKALVNPVIDALLDPAMNARVKPTVNTLVNQALVNHQGTCLSTVCEMKVAGPATSIRSPTARAASHARHCISG